MSNSTITPRFASRLTARLALGLALICGLTPASAWDERSTPEDLRRFVSVTRNLEQAPLEPALKADREWALTWLTNAPDVTVTICADALGSLVKSNYRYAGEIILQNSFAMAALAIEHPEKANDPNTQQLAGLEGALNAYRSILRDKPEARSSALDGLLKTQSRGELPAFVQKAWIRCSAKN
ncbi:MAG TPA: hypothetical protein VF547_08265 [Allosphingosinicella sp.]|jgi:hypothetical protein